MPFRFVHFLFMGFLCTIALFPACRYEEETVSSDSSLRLEFSTDSLQFDTVFSEMLTVTKVFRVYNRNPKAVEISAASVAGGSTSPFQLIVNGKDSGEDKTVRNILLRGGDSLRVLVEARIDGRDQSNPYLILDSLRFQTNGNPQHLILEAYGRDAHYHNNVTVCDTTWTSDKPHVVINRVRVDTGCTLRINAGTEVYMQSYYNGNTGYRGSNLFVAGRLLALGSTEDRISFEGVRQEDRFEDQPGQWGAIVFEPGSQNNIINYTDISEGLRGVQLSFPGDADNPEIPPAQLSMNGVTIRAIEDAGVLTFNSQLEMYNCIISDCAQRNLALRLGGVYQVYNSTFSYSGRFSFFKKPAGVWVNDYYFYDDAKPPLSDTLVLFFSNNIVDGPNEEEFLFEAIDEQIGLSIHHNLFKIEGLGILDTNGNLQLPYSFDSLPGNAQKRLQRMPFEQAREYDFTPSDSVLVRYFENGQSQELYLLPPTVDAGSDSVVNANSSQLNFDFNGDFRARPVDMGAIELP